LRNCLGTYREVTNTNFSVDLIEVSIKPGIDFKKRVNILKVVIDTFKNVETTFKEGVETTFKSFLSFRISGKTIDNCKKKS
jgi:hypothetical protein